jgi:hypothetical protein
MKGLIFAGCSFTWGQGLYYYSDLENQILLSDDEFNQSKITDAQIKIKNTMYFPRLVANHFNTFEIVKSENGGSEYTSYKFVDSLFDGSSKNSDVILFSDFNYDDFEYLIFQTSQIGRNNFKFTHKGIDYDMFVPLNGSVWNENDEKILLEWLIDNNLTHNQWFDIFRNQVFEKLKKFFIFYENKGIKCKVICWMDDLLDLIKNDSFMNERLISIDYNGKKFDSIKYLTDLNKHLLICNDFENLKMKINDSHPSKECHKIIANSIIKKIEKDTL